MTLYMVDRSDTNLFQAQISPRDLRDADFEQMMYKRYGPESAEKFMQACQNKLLDARLGSVRLNTTYVSPDGNFAFIITSENLPKTTSNTPTPIQNRLI
jgi:hypothetical protein